jgi:hypothetical protein
MEMSLPGERSDKSAQNSVINQSQTSEIRGPTRFEIGRNLKRRRPAV